MGCLAWSAGGGLVLGRLAGWLGGAGLGWANWLDLAGWTGLGCWRAAGCAAGWAAGLGSLLGGLAAGGWAGSYFWRKSFVKKLLRVWVRFSVLSESFVVCFSFFVLAGLGLGLPGLVGWRRAGTGPAGPAGWGGLGSAGQTG